MEEIRKQVRKMGPRQYSPSGICQSCNTWYEKLELDHIDPEGPHDTSNLQWLCPGCHSKKTGQENSVRNKGRRVNGKLTNEQADQLRRDYGPYVPNGVGRPHGSPTYADLAKKYGISGSQVGEILKGNCYNGSYHYEKRKEVLSGSKNSNV